MLKIYRALLINVVLSTNIGQCMNHYYNNDILHNMQNTNFSDYDNNSNFPQHKSKKQYNSLNCSHPMEFVDSIPGDTKSSNERKGQHPYGRNFIEKNCINKNSVPANNNLEIHNCINWSNLSSNNVDKRMFERVVQTLGVFQIENNFLKLLLAAQQSNAHEQTKNIVSHTTRSRPHSIPNNNSFVNKNKCKSNTTLKDLLNALPDIASLTQEIQNKKWEIAAKNQENSKLQQQIQSLKKTVTQQEVEIENKNQANFKLQQQIKSLNKTVETKACEIAAKSQENVKLNKQIEILNTQVKTQAAEIKDKSQENSKFQQQIGRLHEKVNKSVREVETTHLENSDLNKEIKSLKRTIQKKEFNITIGNNENSKLTKQIENLNNKLKTQAAEIEKQNQENAELRKQVEQLLEQFSNRKYEIGYQGYVKFDAIQDKIINDEAKQNNVKYSISNTTKNFDEKFQNQENEITNKNNNIQNDSTTNDIKNIEKLNQEINSNTIKQHSENIIKNNYSTENDNTIVGSGNQKKKKKKKKNKKSGTTQGVNNQQPETGSQSTNNDTTPYNKSAIVIKDQNNNENILNNNEIINNGVNENISKKPITTLDSIDRISNDNNILEKATDSVERLGNNFKNSNITQPSIKMIGHQAINAKEFKVVEKKPNVTRLDATKTPIEIKKDNSNCTKNKSTIVVENNSKDNNIIINEQKSTVPVEKGKKKNNNSTKPSTNSTLMTNNNIINEMQNTDDTNQKKKKNGKKIQQNSDTNIIYDTKTKQQADNETLDAIIQQDLQKEYNYFNKEYNRLEEVAKLVGITLKEYTPKDEALINEDYNGITNYNDFLCTNITAELLRKAALGNLMNLKPGQPLVDMNTIFRLLLTSLIEAVNSYNDKILQSIITNSNKSFLQVSIPLSINEKTQYEWQIYARHVDALEKKYTTQKGTLNRKQQFGTFENTLQRLHNWISEQSTSKLSADKIVNILFDRHIRNMGAIDNTHDTAFVLNSYDLIRTVLTTVPDTAIFCNILDIFNDYLTHKYIKNKQNTTNNFEITNDEKTLMLIKIFKDIILYEVFSGILSSIDSKTWKELTKDNNNQRISLPLIDSLLEIAVLIINNNQNLELDKVMNTILETKNKLSKLPLTALIVYHELFLQFREQVSTTASRSMKSTMYNTIQSVIKTNYLLTRKRNINKDFMCSLIKKTQINCFIQDLTKTSIQQMLQNGLKEQKEKDKRK